MKRSGTYCDGLSRRDLLRVGALSGLGLTLADLFRAQAAAAADTPLVNKTDASCIFIWLLGGPSHQDIWDLKPHAPAEFRGDFRPIATQVPGLEISEHLPLTARHAEKFSIVRSVAHPSADHGQGTHYMQTAVLPTIGDFNGKVPNNVNPSFGSVVAKEKGVRGSLPPYISMPNVLRSGSSAYLGAAYAPFVIHSDPSAPQFKVQDVDLPSGIDLARLDDRRAMLRNVNRFQSRAELVQAMDTFYQKAYQLMTSAEAKRAFDLAREPAQTRQKYGLTQLGQSCLMARRLVEAGCRFVSIDNGNWDTHDRNFHSLKNDLLPALDHGYAALLEDLAQRGLLETTLVVIAGEFGRTPRINNNSGRDHWPGVFSVVLAGGGLRGGQVVGASDDKAALPKTEPISPERLAATMYDALGIDVKTVFHTPLGRPVPIAGDGAPLRELV